MLSRLLESHVPCTMQVGAQGGLQLPVALAAPAGARHAVPLGLCPVDPAAQEPRSRAGQRLPATAGDRGVGMACWRCCCERRAA